MSGFPGNCAREVGSEAETLTCLMRHVDSPDMTPVCEKRLLEVQYFMARDWTLDPQLYDACHDEAVRRCGLHFAQTQKLLSSFTKIQFYTKFSAIPSILHYFKVHQQFFLQQEY